MSNDEFSLAIPSSAHQSSFLKLVDDYRKAGELEKYEFYGQGLADFTGYVASLISQASGDNLPTGWVPASTFWLLSPEGEIAGISRLRHSLNSDLRNKGGHIGYDIAPSFRRRGLGSLLLKLTLEKSDQLGIRQLLLTCDVKNIPSRRIIETNGGQLEKISQIPGQAQEICRYWITRPEAR